MGLFDGPGSGDIVTREQIAMEEEIERGEVTMTQALMILKAKEAAVLVERRRCAAIARGWPSDVPYGAEGLIRPTGEEIAEEIERG